MSIDLRDHLTAVTADVAPTAPTLAALQHAARRRGRGRTVLAGGLAVVLVAGAAVAGISLDGEGTRHDQGATTTTPMPDAASPFPQDVVARVGVPAGMFVTAESTANGQVWAVGYRASDHRVFLLHAADGAMLVPVRAFQHDPAAVSVVVRDGRASVVSTRGANDAATDALLRVYDAVSEKELSSTDLATTTGADSASLQTTGAGGPVVVLLIRHQSADRAGLASAVLAPDGSLGRPTPFFPAAPHLFLVGATPATTRPDASAFPVVVATEDGTARYVYEANSPGVITRQDLRTGRLDPVRTDAAVGAAAAKTTQMVGQLGDRMLFQTDRGLVVEPLDALTPSLVAPISNRYTMAGIDGGRLFLYTTNTANLATVRELDATTFRPVGAPRTVPEAVTGGSVGGDGSTEGWVRDPAPDATGGTLVVDAPA